MSNTTTATAAKPQIKITMRKERDCTGSVRFDMPKPKPGQPPNPIQNVYVSRVVPGINEAQEITLTLEVQ